MKERKVSSPRVRLAVYLPLLAASLCSSPALADSPQPTRIDLPGAIKLALLHNPELKAAESDVGVAAAQRERASSERWPTVGAQVGWTEYRRGQRLYPASTPGEPAVVTHHMLGADLVLAVPIYSGGRLSGNVDAAKLAEDAARHASHWARVDLVFRVTATYYSILAQRRLISALDAAEEATAKNIERLRALVAARKATPLDRQRMEVRLAALRQRRVEDEAALEVQTLTLLSLIGLSGERASTKIIGELGMPSLTLPASPEALVEQALARRPDVRASRASVHAQERRVGVAEGGRYPRLFVQGSYGLRGGLWPSEEPDGVDAWVDVGQVGLYVDVPIFDGGRITAEVGEQRARLSSMRERLRQVELRVRLEVEAAVLNYRAASRRVTLSDAVIGQAGEAFRVESEKDSEGEGTVSDVLSSQSELLDAEASRARALADANVAAAGLVRALGETP